MKSRLFLIYMRNRRPYIDCTGAVRRHSTKEAFMQIEIRSAKVEITPAHRDLVRRRASFALSRLKPRVERVDVRFEDVNGTRGGVDKQCRVLVTLSRGPATVVEDRDADLPTLIDRTLARAGRAAAKRIAREGDAAGPRRGVAQELGQ
jgi:putative sigma-54 modulation protein